MDDLFVTCQQRFWQQNDEGLMQYSVVHTQLPCRSKTVDFKKVELVIFPPYKIASYNI